MAQKFAPYIGRNADIIFGDQATGNHFESHVTKVTVTPSAETITSKAMETGAIYQDIDDPTWAMTMEGLQGRYTGTPEGPGTALEAYQKWAFKHHGEKVPVTIRPSATDLTEGLTFTVTVQATDYGFERSAHSTFSVELPLDGNPKYLDGTEFGQGDATPAP